MECQTCATLGSMGGALLQSLQKSAARMLQQWVESQLKASKDTAAQLKLHSPGSRHMVDTALKCLYDSCHPGCTEEQRRNFEIKNDVDSTQDTRVITVCACICKCCLSLDSLPPLSCRWRQLVSGASLCQIACPTMHGLMCKESTLLWLSLRVLCCVIVQ